MPKDRKKTRYNKWKGKQEEHLDKVNGSKVYDPTPYQAVEEIRKKQRGEKHE